MEKHSSLEEWSSTPFPRGWHFVRKTHTQAYPICILLFRQIMCNKIETLLNNIKSNLMCCSNKYKRWKRISLSVWDQRCQWGSRGWRRKLIQALLCLHESQWSEGIREALTPYICWRVRFGVLPHQATPEACRGFTLCFVQNGFLRLHFVITKTVSPVCAIWHGCLSHQPLLPGDSNKYRTVANWRILHEN